jgi:hypothetical protein
MSNDLIMGTAGAIANVPSYAQGESGLGDLGGESFPRLTFKGSRFRVTKGGDEQVLADNELDVVILAANPTVSRIYYAGRYDEASGTGERPVCASADGETPLVSVSAPQSNACMSCPQNEKGSSIGDDGGKRKACSYFHRLVLRLVKYPDLGEIVTEIKAMSLFGTSYPDTNLLNFRHYADRLNQHQTKAHAVITRMSFDTDSSVPKILFQPTAYVSEPDFLNVYDPLAVDPAILAMADTNSIRTGAAGGENQAAAGFREKLMADGTPPAAGLIDPPAETVTPAEPALSPEDQKIADLQKQIEALKAPPEPEPEPKLSPEDQKIADLQAQIAAMQGKIQNTAPTVPAAAASKLAKTAVVAQTPAATVPAGAHVNQHGVAWNPEYHATSGEGGPILNADGHYRARRGLSPEKLAMVKMPQGTPPLASAASPAAASAAVASTPAAVTPGPTPQVEGGQFDADLNAALDEFDAAG